MKNIILSMGAFFLLAFMPAALASDILGNWIAEGYESNPEVVSRVGAIPPRLLLAETVFSFNVDGSKLTGTITDAHGEVTIREGMIKGDRIAFVVVRDVGGDKRKLHYEGQVFLNEIRFTLEVKGLERRPLEFIARREFPRHGDLPLRSISLPKEPLPKK